MIDHAQKGRAGSEFSMAIERGKVREFARATGAEHPEYWTHPTPTIPPTFLTTMAFWEDGVADSNPWHSIGMDPKRGMHAEQAYTFFGPPPRAGTELVCRSRIEDIYEKAGKAGKLTFVVMVTEFRDRSGRLVAEARLTGVEKP